MTRSLPVPWLASSLVLAGALAPADASARCEPCLADVALYDPMGEDDGVWEEEVLALQTFLASMGYSTTSVDAQALNAGILADAGGPAFRALIMPGGYAATRNRDIDASGDAAIRAFIEQGGSYLGFCAGSYTAGAMVWWAETATGGGGAWNRAADYRRYRYDLGLWQGAALGPLAWTPWEGGYGASLQPARLNLQVPALLEAGLPASTRLFYYGGPVFLQYAPPGLEIWAWASAPEGWEGGLAGADQPTIVRYPVGAGQVLLVSYHPEILIDSMVDGVRLQWPLDETAIDWDTGDQSMETINLHAETLTRLLLSTAVGER